MQVKGHKDMIESFVYEAISRLFRRWEIAVIYQKNKDLLYDQIYMDQYPSQLMRRVFTSMKKLGI